MKIFHKNGFYFVLIRTQVVVACSTPSAKINNIQTHSRTRPNSYSTEQNIPTPRSISLPTTTALSTSLFTPLCQCLFVCTAPPPTTPRRVQSWQQRSSVTLSGHPPCSSSLPEHPRLEIQFSAESHLNFYCCDWSVAITTFHPPPASLQKPSFTPCRRVNSIYGLPGYEIF